MRRRAATVIPIILLALSSAAVSDPPHVGTWKNANVADIVVHTDGGHDGKGYVVVTFTANGTGGPNCASGYPRSVAIDLSGPGGMSAAHLAHTAFRAGKPLTVTGTGTCSVSPATETVASVQWATDLRDEYTPLNVQKERRTQ